MINGPEAFTPDGEFILGESEIPGFFVAAGFCAHGIAGAGGVGKVGRSGSSTASPSWTSGGWISGGSGRTIGAGDTRLLGPSRSTQPTTTSTTPTRSGRPAGRSRQRRRTSGCAIWRPSSARRPAGRARTGSGPTRTFAWSLRPRGWAGEHWSTAIPAEHQATREHAGLFDESSFAKIEVEGDDACAFLERICANRIDRPIGRIVYTQMLNRRGGIECDLTVTRLADDRFRLISGTAFGTHDLAWIHKQLGEHEHVRVRDVTGSLACLGLWGPRARDVLEPLTTTDLSNEAFPYMSAREIMAADSPCLAARVTTSVSSGGSCIHGSSSRARCGTHSSRLEEIRAWFPPGTERSTPATGEGYRAGSDITPEDTPLEAGLGFAVDLEKEFLGRDALERQKHAGIPRRLSCLALAEERAMCLGNEPVFADDAVVSRVTSGGIGYTPGAQSGARLPPVRPCGRLGALDRGLWGACGCGRRRRRS